MRVWVNSSPNVPPIAKNRYGNIRNQPDMAHGMGRKATLSETVAMSRPAIMDVTQFFTALTHLYEKSVVSFLPSLR